MECGFWHLENGPGASLKSFDSHHTIELLSEHRQSARTYTCGFFPGHAHAVVANGERNLVVYAQLDHDQTSAAFRKRIFQAVRDQLVRDDGYRERGIA